MMDALYILCTLTYPSLAYFEVIIFDTWLLCVGLSVLFIGIIGLVAHIRLKVFIKKFHIDSLKNKGWYLVLQIIIAFFAFVTTII